MKIDITKKYKTKSGLEVTELHVEPSGDYPICGLVGGGWEWWTEQGDFYIDDTSVMDLVLVEEEPNVELPDPPVGHRWEYRGMGAKFEGDCLYCREESEQLGVGMYAFGLEKLHYWQAVPVVLDEITTEQKLAIAVEALEKARGWTVADEALGRIL